MFLPSCFTIFLMCDDLSFINTMQKTFKPSEKNVLMPRMDEKKLHTWEFQLKRSSRNMRCKLFQKRFTGKTTECSKHLRHIAIEKDILSELNRCIFQISLKYIKLVIPKILFILVLCSLLCNYAWPWYFICKVNSTNRVLRLKNTLCTLCFRGWGFHAMPFFNCNIFQGAPITELF